jgi:hypothetical protein
MLAANTKPNLLLIVLLNMQTKKFPDLHPQGLTPARLVLSIVCSTAPVKVVQIKTRRFARGFLFVSPP